MHFHRKFSFSFLNFGKISHNIHFVLNQVKGRCIQILTREANWNNLAMIQNHCIYKL